MNSPGSFGGGSGGGGGGSSATSGVTNGPVSFGNNGDGDSGGGGGMSPMMILGIAIAGVVALIALVVVAKR